MTRAKIRHGISLKQNALSGFMIVGNIFLMKYMCTCFLRQLFVIAIIILKYHTGVYHKWGSKANGRDSIFAVSHDYEKKAVPERKQSRFC